MYTWVLPPSGGGAQCLILILGGNLETFHTKDMVKKLSFTKLPFENKKCKMDSTLFVPAKLTFSEYLRCLNFPLWTFWPAKTKQVKESNLF